MTRYRTIVADPPWHYAGFGTTQDSPGPAERAAAKAAGEEHRRGYFITRPMPYPTMSVDAICELPVAANWAADDAHLYLWTTQRYLWDAPRVARAWGFEPSCTLIWCKPAAGVHGGAFVANTEFVLFCRRGQLAHQTRVLGQWFEWKRPGVGYHSRKPEAFLDLVEQVSPGPYLELFARRQRLGWDTWGNEALEHVNLGEPAA